MDYHHLDEAAWAGFKSTYPERGDPQSCYADWCPTDNPAAPVVSRCDNANFVNQWGETCASWLGFNCTDHATNLAAGYTRAEMDDLLFNCHSTCCKYGDLAGATPSSEGRSMDYHHLDTLAWANFTATYPDRAPVQSCYADWCPRDEPSVVARCDNPNFVDEWGSTCADWRGYNCTDRASWIEQGWTETDLDNILYNCHTSCCAFGDHYQETAAWSSFVASFPDRAPVQSCYKNWCPTDTVVVSRCDNPDYLNAWGQSCADWAGYNCTDRAQWLADGYTTEDLDGLIYNCHTTCCGSSGDHFGNAESWAKFKSEFPEKGDPKSCYENWCPADVPASAEEGDGAGNNVERR